MSDRIDVLTFFNYRSPYCYLATKRMWGIEDDHGGRLVFKPLGGWTGRSAPERRKVKLPFVRQDVRRWCRRLGVAFNPPPMSTEPTNAGLGALLAIDRGKIREYTNEVMNQEWAHGQDIGQPEVLEAVAETVGLDRVELRAALDDPARRAALDANNEEAMSRGVFGVPSFIVGDEVSGDEVFWGQDRIDFVEEHLDQLRAGSRA